MGRFITRRLLQSVLTIFGVMLITFLLFRVVSKDIASANLGRRATERMKAEWRQRYGYDRPTLINWHHRLTIADHTKGDLPLGVKDVGNGQAAEVLALFLPSEEDNDNLPGTANVLRGRYVFRLRRETPLAKLTAGKALVAKPRLSEGQAGSAAETPKPIVTFTLTDGTDITIDLTGVKTCGDVLDRINHHPKNHERLEASISEWSAGDLWDSQFFHHLYDTATFRTRSLKDNQTLWKIIRQRAPKSLAITVPAFAVGWVLAMIIACFVAYYRGKWIDKLGVFLSVLGMCIPFLAFMIYGQWLMFEISPRHAYGTFYRVNVYVPIVIMVIAGLGGNVRFYRTVILDEIYRDYVRTARAKGASLGSILFKHVLRNCMLPILTSLIMTIPFLIMGSLLVETYFGIPGLGDLMITSIQDRNEPIINAMVFLTAIIYTFGVLITDISYALFDPRIRLQ